MAACTTSVVQYAPSVGMFLGSCQADHSGYLFGSWRSSTNRVINDRDNTATMDTLHLHIESYMPVKNLLTEIGRVSVGPEGSRSHLVGCYSFRKNVPARPTVRDLKAMAKIEKKLHGQKVGRPVFLMARSVKERDRETNKIIQIMYELAKKRRTPLPMSAHTLSSTHAYKSQISPMANTLRKAVSTACRSEGGAKRLSREGLKEADRSLAKMIVSSGSKLERLVAAKGRLEMEVARLRHRLDREKRKAEEKRRRKEMEDWPLALVNGEAGTPTASSSEISDSPEF